MNVLINFIDLVNHIENDIGFLFNLSVDDTTSGFIVVDKIDTKDSDYNHCTDYILECEGVFVRCRLYGEDKYDEDCSVVYSIVNKVEKEVVTVKYTYEEL